MSKLNTEASYQFGNDVAGLQSPPIRHNYMNELVKYYFKQSNTHTIRLLEIGSWVGSSTITWAKALQKLTSNIEIYCVDPWEPYFDTSLNSDEHYHLMNEVAADKKALNIFQHNIKHAQIENIISSCKGTSKEILPHFPHDYFDIIYIDGSHLYSDVKYDIKQAKQLIKPQGIICGDDLELQLHEVNQELHSEAMLANKDFITDSLNRSYHPGVTQAIAEDFTSVSVFSGLWAIQRQNRNWANISLPELTSIDLPAHIESQPYFLMEYRKFNLIKYGDEICCINQNVGRVDITQSKDDLLNSFSSEMLFFTTSIDSAKNKVNKLIPIESHTEEDIPNA